MVLLLVTHVVEVPSSRVPLSVIILNDAIKRKSLPPNLKCRFVIPSAGNYSASIWDASSIEDLQQWIDTNLMDGVAHIAEVPEEFTYGLALELTTSRAADKIQVATSSKNTIERLNSTGVKVMESVAEKVSTGLDRLDARTNLISATREATSAAVVKVKQATDRALESEGVQKSLASLSTSLQNASNRMNKAFSWVGSKVKENFPAAAAAAGGPGQPYNAFASEDAAAPPPAYDAAVYSSPAYMPVSTNPLGRASQDEAEAGNSGAPAVWGSVAGAPTENAAPVPHFTLHDEGFGSPQLTPSTLPELGGNAAESEREGLPLIQAPLEGHRAGGVGEANP
ncbi:hypothetical protein Agub_g10468 [Astrephomene gubernaculifera]|uniref:Uncharacterized protein n=1 Tax=Astrephomene gubernaculifera TaxID=47775 RepID=A0AAD3DV43_9CHLO|nr:hypothetical protein Agub_g10468 [Astrephomene gubernaculifera]